MRKRHLPLFTVLSFLEFQNSSSLLHWIVACRCASIQDDVLPASPDPVGALASPAVTPLDTGGPSGSADSCASPKLAPVMAAPASLKAPPRGVNTFKAPPPCVLAQRAATSITINIVPGCPQTVKPTRPVLQCPPGVAPASVDTLPQDPWAILMA